MTTENKCPLCGKLNPLTEWACEDCGAELPMHGKRESTLKRRPTAAIATPTPSVGASKFNDLFQIAIFVGALILAFFVYRSIFIHPVEPTVVSIPRAAVPGLSTVAATATPGGNPAPPVALRAPNAPVRVEEVAPPPPPAPVEPQASTVNREGDVKVWVNTNSGIYHYPGTRYYGTTAEGKYMMESKAKAQGYFPAANGQ